MTLPRFHPMAVGTLILLLAIVSCGEGTASGGRQPARIRAVSGDAQTGMAGIALPSPLVVEVRANDTLPLPGVRVDFFVTAGNALVSPVSAVTDGSGRAQATVTPQQAGALQVRAVVFSSRITVDFMAAASGPPPAPCSADGAIVLAKTQVVGPLGGSRLCLAGGVDGGRFVLVVANTVLAPVVADVALSLATVPAVVSARGTAPGIHYATRADLLAPSSMRFAAWSVSDDERATLAAFIPPARDWWESRPIPSSGVERDTLNGRRLLNVNFARGCDAPNYRVGRVVARSNAATVIVDSMLSPGVLDVAELDAVAATFDTLVYPAVTLSFLAPADVDDNARVALFFTSAVNAVGVSPPFTAAPNAISHPRDLLPNGLNGSPDLCSAGNLAEIIYVAVPDSSGAFGPARARDEWLADLPRALAHELQHVVNGSRRIYANESPMFEVRWLDEALGQIAEELAFYRAAPRMSRENLGAHDVGFTIRSLAAYQTLQAQNVEQFGSYLRQVSAGSPFGADAPSTRGASWSMLRYLLDRRRTLDFSLLTPLLNSADSGVANLRSVFGEELSGLLRDWSVSLFTDDVFATAQEHQQPSWNFRSLSLMSGQPYPLALQPLEPSAAFGGSVAPGTAAFLTFEVTPGALATVDWTATADGTPWPWVQLMLVRVN